MKLKKILPLMLSLGLLTGCASTGGNGNDEIVTEIKEPVEITFWHAMNGEQEKSLQKLTEKFTSENSNIKVTLQNQSSYPDLQQKITSTVSSPKDLPTMTQAYPDWMLNAVKDNLVVDLGQYINNETL
ncbi:ABC-type glycerol-3-phosphate transport system substrate-binding protein [Clostridium sardiniense]|nr:ABC-type glycerol-3-phosphate transport system substrate-binding protein [Clostridium sardiniense]